MKNYILKQLEFEIWANQILADTIGKANQPDKRTLELFSHVLSVYSIWLSRVNNTTAITSMWQERTLAESSQFMNTVFKEWKMYLQNADEVELNRIVHFIFPIDGSKRKISVIDGITHVFSHSCYHRGQIISQLKGKVEPLPLAAYVVFASELDK
jgi:uncharacterized damage-inducible protein DinB